MGWRSWIIEKLNPAQPAIASSEGGVKSGENIVDFEKAYQEIDIVHRSIDMIVSACVDVPFEITSPNERGPIFKVNKILNDRPNPWEDKVRLFRRAYLDLILDGNAFIYVEPTSNSLYVLPANRVSIIPDKKTFVAGYTYDIASADTSMFGRRKPVKDGEFSIQFLPEEIIHIRTDNDESIYRGKSQLTALRRLLKLYYSMIDFQSQFFQNNAVPGIVLITDNVLSRQVKERLLAHWNGAYNSLFKGARSPAILDGGLKIDKIGAGNFSELDFEVSVQRVQTDMAKTLGVPYVLLNSGNNANLEANEKLFYMHTVLPLLNMFASAFQQFFGPDLKIIPDILKISVMQPDIQKQALYASTLVNGGMITPNESREFLGWEPSTEPEMNKIRVPENIAGSATNPSMGGRPSSGAKTQ